MFKKSIANQKNEKITARTTFWKGETEYGLDNFGDALQSFKQFESLPEAKTTPENKNINYNIAYAYFKQKEYDQAGNYFQKYVDGTWVKLDRTFSDNDYNRSYSN